MSHAYNNSPIPSIRGGAQPEPQPVQPVKPGPVVVPVPPPQQEPRRFPLWGIFLMVLVVVGGLAYYYKAQQAAQMASGAAASIPTATATTDDVVETIRVSGTITAANQQTILAPRIQGSRTDVNRGGAIGAQTAGRGGGLGNQTLGAGFGAAQMNDFSLVLIKLATAGGHVKTGDVIAQFDPQMQQQRLADYADTIIQTEASIKSQMARLDAQAEQHDQTVRSSKASWDQAILDEKQKPVVSRIQAELYGLSSDQAKATYDQLVYEDSIVDAIQRSQIKSSELTRDQSKLEQQRAEQNVKKMTMTAPMDGIVVYATIVRNSNELGQVQIGDQVTAGQPFMYIVDPNSMVLNAQVNQVDAERLRIGYKARIRLDAYADIELPGTVEGIGAMSKSSVFRAGYVGVIPVRVKLDKQDERVIPDLTGSAEISLSAEANAVSVPRGAVFDEGGGHFVFVKNEQGGWTKKQVEIGVRGFTKVAIHSGVAKGDVVALDRPKQ